MHAWIISVATIGIASLIVTTISIAYQCSRKRVEKITTAAVYDIETPSPPAQEQIRSQTDPLEPVIEPSTTKANKQWKSIELQYVATRDSAEPSSSNVGIDPSVQRNRGFIEPGKK